MDLATGQGPRPRHPEGERRAGALTTKVTGQLRNLLSATIGCVGGLPRITLSGGLEGEYVVLARRPNGSLLIAPVREVGKAPRLVALRQMTSAHPAQWEGALEDGRTLFAHFKRGLLSVGVGENLDEAIGNSSPKEALYSEHVGDDFWAMGSEGLRGHLYGLVEFPEGLVVEGRVWGDSDDGRG